VILRLILEAVVTVLVISALRSVIGIIAKAFFQSMTGQRPQPEAARRPSVPTGGELKKDPVCGTYISTATALQKKSGGETYYFCSPECRDKFRG
jgi:YHS domain-containing protein